MVLRSTVKSIRSYLIESENPSNRGASSKSCDLLDLAILIIGVGMTLYHLAYSQYLIQAPIRHVNTHLALGVTLLLLDRLRKNRRRWPVFLALVLLTLLATGYVHVFHEELDVRAYFNTPLDLVVGVILVIIALEATRGSMGIVLPVMALVSIAYAFLGQYLPEPFHSMEMPWDQIVSRLSIGLVGMYGEVIAVSANFVFLFMVFGAVLQTTGAVEFFIQVGKLLSRRLRAGPAMASVVTSALCGMISGQAGANVTVTGSFTIPLMKKVGYKPEQAGAIEAAASTGGPITPPVMGVAAFLIVGITGIPYGHIIVVAAVPALLYFIGVGLYVHFQAAKMNITATVEPVNVKELLLRAPLFVIPFLTIIVLFVNGYSPMYVGFWAVVLVIILSLFRKETRPSLPKLANGFATGAIMGGGIAASCACIGMMVSMIAATGLGLKLPVAIERLCGDHILFLLLLTAVVSTVLGMGMPASASYVLVAIVIAPVLVRLGLTKMQAHLFAFYFANFSYLTPPVALAAMFGSQLAQAPYLKTSLEAVKVGIGGFLLPFMIVWYPLLTLLPVDVFSAIMGLTACVTTFIALEAAFVGYFLTTLHWIERVMGLLCGLVLIAYLYMQNSLVFGLGLSFFFIIIVWQLAKRKLFKQP